VISHYLQRNGIPTTTISLIREHTEMTRQPRALWVPFPLGRPLGVAGDPDFQRDVLRSALRLLDTATEPVIEDYPHDAPDGGGDGVWSCSIMLPEPEVSDLEAAIRGEVDLLTPWYEEARRRRGRTTVGISGVKPEEIDKAVSFIVAIAEGSGFQQIPVSAEGPNWRHPLPMLVRFAVEDLRAFYQEAVTSQEGTKPPSQHDMHSWIFNKTTLGRAIMAVGHQIADNEDRRLMTMRGLMIPEGFWEGEVSWGELPPGMDRLSFIKSSRAYLAGEEAEAR